MYLKSLSLRSVRNYRRLDLDLSPGMNLFYGENAQGKTNLLEAVCLLASLRSFRGVKASSVIFWGEKDCSISGEAAPSGHGGQKRSRRLQVGLVKGGRKVLIDGKRPTGAGEYLLALKVASFSPDDLFLVKEYPSSRRRFIDRSIFHMQPAYLDLVNECRAAVKQLNSAMKARDKKVVEAWEEVLAPLAAEVHMRRRARVEELSGRAALLYEKTLGGGGLGLAYRSPVKGDDKAGLTGSYHAMLEKKRDEGMKRGYCLVGPHTDDLVISISGREMRNTASRGQSRLALLALVLADSELYAEKRGRKAVLLLDDVASELDGRRKDALMEYVSGAGQALLTSTDPALTKGRKGAVYKVEQAQGEAGVVCR